jgi:hypothetical protein
MFRRIASLVTILLAAGAGGAAAQENTQTFNTPTINGVRLDWCRHFGTQCGEPAANLFCQRQGFTRAVRFSIDPGIGRTGVPTVILADGQLCRAAICSGFRAITCARPAPVTVTPTPSPERPAKPRSTPNGSTGPDMIVVPVNEYTTRFRYPHVDEMRLDWCLNWGSNCGEPAANLFCEEMGFSRASRYVKDVGTGRRGIYSLVYGDERVCSARYCNAFELIACTRRPDEETVAETDALPDDEDVGPGEESMEMAFIAPLPSPKPPAPLPSQDSIVKPAAQPRPVRPDDEAEPASDFSGFEPPAPTVVAVNWVNLLDTIDEFPAGASLFNCTGGDCSPADAADFEIDPEADDQNVQLNFSVDTVPHASGALWQVSYLPFPPFARGSESDLSPQGLLDYETVNVPEGFFTFNPQDLVSDLPGGEGPAILHVRVLPVTAAGLEQVVGQPSNTVRIFYGADLPPQLPYVKYPKQSVPDSQPKVRLKELGFQPFHRVEQWPPGCRSEDGADEAASEREETAQLASWRWDSKSYQWMKTRMIDIAGTLMFETVSDNAIEFALSTALVSAGIPPDIPNIDVIMIDGVDGLAQDMAKTLVQQVPDADLADNLELLGTDPDAEPAADLSEAERRERLRHAIEEQSRQALLQAADELGEALSAQDRNTACADTYFQGVYKVTVENTGEEPLDDLVVGINAAPVYRQHSWTVDLAPGEERTLVSVGAPKLPNGPYSQQGLTPGKQAEENMNRWRSDIVQQENVKIEVTLPGALECLDGDPASRFCERQRVVAHASPPQLVTETYEFEQ